MLVPWIFDYYTKLDFYPAHKIHKIHAFRMISASSALSSCFCYRGLARYATVAPASILDPSGGLFLAAARPCQRPTSLCLLFIHPRAPNLISLRSAGTMPA